MKRGEVYYAEFNNFFGSVQHGERPCVILQNDIGNTHSTTTIVAPMTTRHKKDMPTHVETSELDENLAAGTTVLLEQVCTIDKQKIKRFVCTLSKETMNNVDTALKISLSLKEKGRCEKMKDTIKINDREIHVKEYVGKRVVTFKDIDDVHERPDGTAKRNFDANRQLFIEGEDFFLISKSEGGADFVQTYGFGESAPSGILITENGYLMIAKSITGDLTLEVQGKLVKSYFNRKSQMPAEEMMREKLSIIDEHERRIKELEDCITIDYKNQRALEMEVNKTVTEALGGKESNAYKEISKKAFAECNRDLKIFFGVNSRNDIAIGRFDEAMEYVKNWRPCTNTEIMIRNLNK